MDNQIATLEIPKLEIPKLKIQKLKIQKLEISNQYSRTIVLNPPVHPVELPIDELLKSCSVKRTRGSGPGGQHRNKVETAIVITHIESGVVGQASEKRSQHRNHEAAVERLRVNLALAIRTPEGMIQSPSPLWRSRVKSKKLVINPAHEDFPRMLCEAIDVISAQQFDVGKAAQKLEVSSSQLVKFLKLAPAAFDLLNRERASRSLRKLS